MKIDGLHCLLLAIAVMLALYTLYLNTTHELSKEQFALSASAFLKAKLPPLLSCEEQRTNLRVSSQ